MLRALSSARRRLRDVAAGSLASAEAEVFERARRSTHMAEERQRMIEEAPARLLAAGSASELLLADEERRLAERRLAESEQERQAAVRESQARQQVLARREADLRVAERVLERTLEQREQAAQREEQRALDDRAGSQGRRDS